MASDRLRTGCRVLFLLRRRAICQWGRICVNWTVRRRKRYPYFTFSLLTQQHVAQGALIHFAVHGANIQPEKKKKLFVKAEIFLTNELFKNNFCKVVQDVQNQ